MGECLEPLIKQFYIDCSISFRWAKPHQKFYGGPVKGESAMEYFDDVGQIVDHTYMV